MLKKIKQLEQAASGLEPGADERIVLTARAIGYAEEFLTRLPDMRAYGTETGQSKMLDQPFSEQASELSKLLEVLTVAVDEEGLNAASGGHMAYIPGGGLYPSALGDYLADVSNHYCGIAFASPGGVKMEQCLIRWMCELVGYPDSAGGDLTSGGSIANLTAIVTAREIMGIRARDVDHSCVYMTAQVHHCVAKSLRAAGLADCHHRVVTMDKNFRMDVVELERMIKEDQAAGLQPWLVTASVGTTDTGAVDPIQQIADVVKRHNLWLHVDAAYGGFFLLCEEGREVLRGLDKAHSIVMDPHKGMFLPYGSGAVLVKEVDWLARAQAYNADYMQDASPGEGEYSPADLSLELSRPFRGLRFWLPLKLFGVAAFRAALAEKIWLARYFYQQLANTPSWEMGPEPDLSVFTFRYVPAGRDANSFNQRLVGAVREDGKVFISSTQIDGNFVLRLAVLHFRTHLDQVDYLLALLNRKVQELSQNNL